MGRKGKHLWFCLTVLLLGTGCSVEVPEQVFMEGMNAIQQRNFIYALMQFDKFLQKYPHHEYEPTVLIQKAVAHWHLREYPQAIQACERVVAGYPNTNKSVEAVFLKGQILQDQGEWEEAVALYEDLKEDYALHRPIYQDAWRQQTEVYVRTKQWPQAIAAYSAMIDSSSVDASWKPRLLLFKGRCYLESGEKEKASEVFESVSALYPDSPEAPWGKVEIARLLKESDPQASERYLHEAIETYRQRAKEPLEATAVLSATSAPLQTEGYPGGPPRLSPAEDREVQSAFDIAGAYAFTGYTEQALEELEDIKSRFLHHPGVFQAAMSQIQAIRQHQERIKESTDVAVPEEVSAATAAVGSVSP